MQAGPPITLQANVPQQVLVPGGLVLGVRLLVRATPAGNVYYGTNNQVSTSTGVLVAQGAPNVSQNTTIPPQHFNGTNGVGPAGALWLVSDTNGMIVDVSSQ